MERKILEPCSTARPGPVVSWSDSPAWTQHYCLPSLVARVQTRVGRISVMEKRGKRNFTRFHVRTFPQSQYGHFIRKPSWLSWHHLQREFLVWKYSIIIGWQQDSKWTVITTHITYIGGSRISDHQIPRCTRPELELENLDFHNRLEPVVPAQKPECAFCVQGAWKVVALAAVSISVLMSPPLIFSLDCHRQKEIPVTHLVHWHLSLISPGPEAHWNRNFFFLSANTSKSQFFFFKVILIYIGPQFCFKM